MEAVELAGQPILHVDIALAELQPHVSNVVHEEHKQSNTEIPAQHLSLASHCIYIHRY